MTLLTTSSRKDYTGNGSTTVFAYDFLITANGDLGVYLDGVKKTLTTDYTVSGAGVPTGGNVTFVVAPGSGVAISILREVPYTQGVAYVENQKFPAATHEGALDRVTMLAQQLLEKIGRALTFKTQSALTGPVMADGVIGKSLRWKTATELENIDLASFGAVGLPLVEAQGGTGGTDLAVQVGGKEITFSKRQHWAKGADVASAAALTPGIDGNFFHVTGTTTITSISSKPAGSSLLLEFDAALILTHNATSLILPTGANITTAAGDIAIFASEGSGNWRCLVYQRKDGSALAGSGGSYGVRNLVGQNDATTPNTKFGYSADLVILRNPTDGSIIVRTNTGTLTNDTALAGGPLANGRDQAAGFALSSWVHFYFIWNGTTLATLSSSTAPPTGPVFPTGYTHWAYAGAVFYNATPVLVKTRWRGILATYENAQNVLNAGAATVETAVGVSSLVPPNALMMALRVETFASNVASATVTNKIRYITGNDFINIRMIERGEYHTTEILLPNSGQQFFYLDAAAADTTTVDVLGFSMPNGGE